MNKPKAWYRDDEIKKMVFEENQKLGDTGRWNRHSILENKCQEIIYDEWGLGQQSIWDRVTYFVWELLGEEE